MKFLYEKVYSNQYFALILFVTIAVLLVLFAIVLFAAIKDTKKRKLAELDKLEKENIDAMKEKALSDTDVFGFGKASFKEEAPKQTLEFFKSEEEQSKTKDIVLSPPITENSMNNLLSEFEEEKNISPSVNKEDVPIVKNDINTNSSYQDIVPDEIEAPVMEKSNITAIPPVGATGPVVPITNVEPISPNLENITYPPRVENNEFANITPKVEEITPVEEIQQVAVQEMQTTTSNVEEISIDDNDDFELPAIKEEVVNNNYTNINLEKEIEPSISKSGIDFGKTGIINFTNIESESYEIK